MSKEACCRGFKGKDKKRSWKFWILFWLVALILLAGWTVFWRVKHQGYLSMVNYAKPVVNLLPINQEQKDELRTVFDIIPKIANGKEKTFLILFQNNHELRPGGGYIGSFGILKIKNEKVTFIDTHDTNVFDSGFKTKIKPPYPMGEKLNIEDWELRDSNWSPDFPTNAKKAEEFYWVEGGLEELDGVVAISTKLLPSFLEITGPISVEGYPGEYSSENAISKLQYQVEQGYAKQNIEEGKRKYIMKDLSKKIIAKIQSSSISRKKELLKKIEDHLNQRDVMIYFKDNELQTQLKSIGWDGSVKEGRGDFLMMVDANLASYKSDQFIRREFEYTVDFRKKKPTANLKITYNHTGRLRDWMTTDYTSYLRIYAHKRSWMTKTSGLDSARFSRELGKKYFGFLITVPLGKKKTIEINYDLPETIKVDDYDLLIQKQSGVIGTKGVVKIIGNKGRIIQHEVDLKKDWLLSGVSLD